MSLETNTIPTIQETDPTVVMDANLGQGLPENYVIDFDYDAYRKMIDKVAGQAIDASGLTVHVTNDLPKRKYGYYSPPDNRIDVRPGIENRSETQRGLQHETKHFTDHELGIMNKTLPGMLTYAAARVINRAKYPITAANLAFFYGFPAAESVGVKSSVTTHLAEMATHNQSMFFIAPAVVAAALARYQFDPHERRAFDAEKRWTSQVLSTTYQPKSDQ